jgi:hypothetical protein
MKFPGIKLKYTQGKFEWQHSTTLILKKRAIIGQKFNDEYNFLTPKYFNSKGRTN